MKKRLKLKMKSTKLYAWAVGVYEFRRIATTSFDEPRRDSYEHGRKLAHKLTGGFFEFGVD